MQEQNILKTNIEEIKKNISIENDFLVNFLNFFGKYNRNLYGYFYENLDISNCFFDIIKFNLYELQEILNLLYEIKNKLSNEELKLCQDKLDRGIYDVNWIINEKLLYKEIFNNFKNVNTLSDREIINKDYEGSDSGHEGYLINNFSNKQWQHLEKSTIVNFLQGLDFSYLSNDAYFLVLLACIRHSIENFENEQEPILEFLIFFLSDENRIKVANYEITNVVISYLELLKKLKFIPFFNKKEQQCLDLWLNHSNSIS